MQDPPAYSVEPEPVEVPDDGKCPAVAVLDVAGFSCVLFIAALSPSPGFAGILSSSVPIFVSFPSSDTPDLFLQRILRNAEKPRSRRDMPVFSKDLQDPSGRKDLFPALPDPRKIPCFERQSGYRFGKTLQVLCRSLLPGTSSRTL